MYLFNEIQIYTIQICCTLLYIILKTYFFIKDSNSDLVHLLFYHVKYLLISQISQLWHVIPFERSSSGISHLRQSSSHPMSSFVFMKSAKFIRCFHESRNNLEPYGQRLQSSTIAYDDYCGDNRILIRLTRSFHKLTFIFLTVQKWINNSGERHLICDRFVSWLTPVDQQICYLSISNIHRFQFIRWPTNPSQICIRLFMNHSFKEQRSSRNREAGFWTVKKINIK